MVGDPAAEGARIEWQQVPGPVRAAIEDVCGAEVAEARTQPGGFSPGLAARVRCANGARFFVKAVSAQANPNTPGLHRQEGRVLAALEPVITGRRLPIPRLHGMVDRPPWVALVLQDVAGHHPALPWQAAELQQVVAALNQLAQALTPAPVPVPAVSERLGAEFTGWRTMATSAHGDRLDSWSRAHLDQLAALEAPQAVWVGVVPRQLPAGVGFFAGREAELKQLDELLDQAGLPDGVTGNGGLGGTVVISAVAGMAGVGKTALAVHWAHRVAARFPDGQLYVNLHGFGPGVAVTADEATGWFLAALGVPAAQIPADAQARCGLYRSVLAGRRVLIVLDNARDAAQVRPLLPGGSGCLVVVTSRSALAGLAAADAAHPLRLGPLNDEESALLLAARLGLERVAAEPGAVTELISRCGHLPLALAVMAARAAADPDLPLGVLAAQLARTPDAAAARQQPSGSEGPGRLEVLDTGDPASSLSELLSWSHRQLSQPATAMFARLGLHCGPDITVPAAASVAGVPRPDARKALAELADASLTAEHRPGRYVMHDLVRGYAAAQARQALGEADIRAAIGPSLDHYLHTMAIWSDIPRSFRPAPPAPGVVPERLAGEAQQVDWAWAEHQVLLRAIAQAAAAGRTTQAWQIFERQSWFLGDQGYWADCQAAGQAVLAAAQAAGDHAALGWTHMIIGRHCAFAGALDDGRAYLSRAQDHLSRAGDLRGQVSALLLSSWACGWEGDWAEGATLAGQALTLSRQSGRQGRWALYAIGECHAHLGNYDLARGYARQALELGADPHDPTNLALAWGVLGLVHHRLGERHHAISCYRRALVFANQWKTPLARRWLASLLADFGDACRAAGDLPAAAGAWRQALQILDDLGLPDSLEVRARLEQADPPSPPG